ncbi:uncharacterized protein RAG0_10297 [Rhynchosporium agropyri]|uniref:Uncharacterized protein n=1 Tax=Rhynchosporium agropyri TaxID=914238 RepID=A0A1E1KZ95_9HELO|nr:uncharacterized protein RAG0_10297 [Rhynchosporium agropyri]
MAAGECIPFIPESSAPSSNSSTCHDDDSATLSDVLDAEKGGRYHDNDYSRVALEDFRPSSQKDGHIGFRARLTAYRRNFALGFLTLLALGVLSTVTIQAIRTSSMEIVAPGRIPGLEYTADGRLLTCGDTFEEAEAAGCKFDIMTFVYTPPACYDEEAALDAVNGDSELAPSRATGVWPWWRYENQTDPLPQTVEVLSSIKPVWTNNVYHRAHCLYLWRVSHRAMTRVASSPPGGVWVYEKMVEWAHVTHCNKLLNNMEKPESWPAQAVKRIGSCVRLDGPSEAATTGGRGLFG